MSDFCRVAWSEGMFLRPQHFQQQERSLNFQLQQNLLQQSSYYWGVTELSVDRSLLSNSKFGLSSISACLQDGAAMVSPTRDPLPEALSLDSSIRDQLVYLALPTEKSNGLNVSAQGRSVTRYRFVDHEVVDTNIGNDAVEVLQLAQAGFELKLESDNLSGYDTLAIAKIIEVSEEGQVSLDEKFIPASLNAQANSVLKQQLAEVHGMLRQRAEALAARIGAGQGSASSIADFLMLQLLNRYDALIAHILATNGLHPERLFQELAGLAGELATFSSKDKRAPQLPGYQHDELTRVFGDVMVVLNQFMSMVLEQTAVQIALDETNYGIRIAQVQDKGLLERAEFVLAVNANISPDELRKRFPAQVKIGPVEHIRDLVNNQLPGISAIGLPVAPRQIPYHAGFHYFKLDKSNDYWSRLSASGGVAIHLSGNYPELEMQIWAISQ
ncbi:MULTISPECIES: type VI secretion system baseplate subunit TssK [Agarivorans]|uniref:type VI secretion system baseplate subunit TssK n=1 Tax=Agarivorans TaxID=261825 RepID=UPI001C811988|nr:type VI secretion system baseplate subunit TssK [Agarivorans aestuarii]